MTQSEINKLHKSIATDFKIVTRKTELWELSYCYQILHDIKTLMIFQYLEAASLIMNNHYDQPIKAKKYLFGYTNRTQDHRPGGIDWEEDEGKNLIIVLTYTPQYHKLSNDEKIAFQSSYLKIPWAPTNIDTNFAHLTKTLSKNYTIGGSGVDRLDFN